MQKLVFIKNVDDIDCTRINEKYLDDGWTAKSIHLIDQSNVLILLDKETRREKLEHLNSLNT